MKTTIKLAIGFLLTFVFVLQPIRTSVMASLALKSGLDLNGQAQMLFNAQSLDPCNSDISNKLGDIFLTSRNYLMATIAYGKGIPCSPGRAELRFKYGQSLLGQGFLQGREFVYEAFILEPNNPYYKAETERLTKFQSPSQ